MTRILLLLWGLLLWNFLPAAAGEYPLILKGSSDDPIHEDFEYIPITDGDGNYSYSIDGSPLYQGMKTLDDRSTVYVLQSWKTLLKKGRVKGMEKTPVWSSRWLQEAFEIKIHPSQIEALLQDLKQDQTRFKSFFTGMSERKYQIFRQLLFEKNLEVTANDFKVLQRNALNPNPSSIVVPINFPDLFQGYWKMEMDIQIEKINFEILEKAIEFNPEEQTFEIVLRASGAFLKGPAHERGYPKGMQMQELPRSLKWDKKSYVEYGAVKGLALRVKIQFLKEKGFWKIAIPNQGFELEFLEENPTVQLILNRSLEPLSQTMIEDMIQDYFSPDSGPIPDKKKMKEEFMNKGWGDYVDTVFVNEIDLSSDAQAIIRRTLSDAIRSSLRSRIFPNALGFELNLKEAGSLESQLQGFRIEEDGLWLSFDLKVDANLPPGCAPKAKLSTLSSYFKSNDPLGTLFSRKIPISSEKSNWSVQLEDTWRIYNKQSEPYVDLALNKEGWKAALISLWLNGSFCVSSEDWWPRLSYIPPLEFHLLEPPHFVWTDSTHFKIKSNGELRTYNWEDLRLEEVKRLQLESEVSLMDEGKRLQIDTPQILFSDYNEGQTSFASRVVPLMFHMATEAQGYSNGLEFNIKESALLSAKDWMRFVDFRWDQEGLLATIEPSQPLIHWKRPDQKVKERKPIRSIIQKLKNDQTQDWMTKISWQPLFGTETEVFYSWRYRSETAEWTPWSPPEIEKRAILALGEEGFYEFQVRAHSRWFEVEQNPSLYRFEYTASSPAELDKTKTIERKWVDPNVEKDQQKIASPKDISVTPSKPSSGFMGCQLQSRSNQSFSFWIILVLSGFIFYSGRRYVG